MGARAANQAIPSIVPGAAYNTGLIIVVRVLLARACYNDQVMRSLIVDVRSNPIIKRCAASRCVPALLVLTLSVSLFALTLAPGTLYGDPSEYQFIPAIWGIAHPPGYAFYTLLAGVWQRIIAVGSIAYRTNLLSAFAGAWAASRVTTMVLSIAVGDGGTMVAARREDRKWVAFSAVLAGIAVAIAPDVWQHSIHANSHIVSAAITATQLWLLVEWWRSGRTAWLFALACLVGIGVTHHPITVWGIPGYLLFIVLHRPKIVTEWRAVLGGVGCALLGLLPWLYFPLRSASVSFGPTDMATWDGFLRHATAQGLRVNLFYFGPADLPDRLRVFLSLVHLQFELALSDSGR